MILIMNEKIIKFPEKRPESAQNEYLDKKILTEMLEFLISLKKNYPFSFNPKNIELCRKELEEASDKEIYGWINESNESHWKVRPSFYHALIAEKKRRKIL